MHLYRYAKPATFTGSDGSVAGHHSTRDILFVLSSDKFDSTAEASCIARGEQVFWRRRVRQSGAAHFLANGQIHADRMVCRFRMPISATRVDSGCGDQWFDCVYSHMNLRPIWRKNNSDVHLDPDQ